MQNNAFQVFPTAAIATAFRLRRASLATALIACFTIFMSMTVGEHGARADEVPADPAILAIEAFIAENPPNTDASRWRTRLSKPPKLQFDPERTYYWKLDTNVGEIRFKLFPDIAPMHVSSTIYLTKVGFYDTLKFHRVIKGFMAQGGDPLGNGRGGPGYKFAGEFSPKVKHSSAGTLSMANSGPGTDGSQFFITFKATPALNKKHTVYGRAKSKQSLATIKAMEALGRRRDPAPPKEPLFIKEATIEIE